MASERQNMSDQDLSIKERERELYVKPVPASSSRPVKPFPIYLRETPAEPLSTATKAILWMVGIVVATLFLAALWRVSHRQLAKPQDETGQPAAKTTMLFAAPRSRLTKSISVGRFVGLSRRARDSGILWY